MNLIPASSPYITGNYWCSWCSQSMLLEEGSFPEIPYTDRMRANLNEKFLFDPEKGLLTAYDFGGCRSDLIALLDDGWDVAPCDDKAKFGSLLLNPEHFPSFAVPDDPAESLKRLSDRVKSLGYRGLGIWIAPQFARASRDVPDVDFIAAREYWSERAKWCGYAGIRYWKIDWGDHCGDAAYRNMMTEVCRLYAPDLIVEHAWVRMPTDLEPEKRAADKDYQFGLKMMKSILPYCDAFRTYDISEPFRYASTLNRIAEVFRAVEGGKAELNTLGLINAEFMAPISTGLGGSIGIMGHEAGREKYQGKTEILCTVEVDEAFRALRWNRIARPFSVFKSENHISGETLTDSMYFDQKDWPWLKGTVKQTAPARMSRNCPLPEVRSVREDGLVPFALACRYPEGQFAVTTLLRTLDNGRRNFSIPADVSVCGASASKPVAVCGVYHTLKIRFDQNIEGKKVLMQDLLADEAEDCTDQVGISGDTLTLDGSLISRIGLAAKTHPGDISEPGLILQLI